MKWRNIRDALMMAICIVGLIVGGAVIWYRVHKSVPIPATASTGHSFGGAHLSSNGSMTEATPEQTYIPNGDQVASKDRAAFVAILTAI